VFSGSLGRCTLGCYDAGVALHTDLKVSHRLEGLWSSGMRVRDMNRTDTRDMEWLTKQQRQWDLSSAVYSIKGVLETRDGCRYQNQALISLTCVREISLRPGFKMYFTILFFNGHSQMVIMFSFFSSSFASS
jgi:hypothetical protein